MPPTNLPIQRITIHCTDTPLGRPESVEDVRKMHLARGWSDIGYHYLIGLKGEVGAGRKEETIPAAVYGYNRGMLAIAYVGGMDADGKAADTRTPEQKEALAKLVYLLAHNHGLPASSIYGHRDWDHVDPANNGKVGIGLKDCKKMCPCFEVSEERLGWLQQSA